MPKTLRVLIIEDSPDDTELLLRELRRGGYEPSHERTDTAAATSAALGRGPWDVVIADHSLPQFSGLEALDLLKQTRRDIPFLIVSGTIGEETAVAVMKAGADDYIMKDKLARLVPAVEHALRDAEVRRERRRADEDLRRSRASLRALAARLQTTREEESARIAREVHDELGQALTALKMDLAWVDHRLASGGNAEVSRAREKIVEMTQLIDATAQTVRRVATELRPGLLDDMGLVAAIESQVRDFQNRTGCRCEWELPAEPIQLDKQLATALFRVVQESLTNIARHAQATEARVRLQVVEGDLVLEIRDNGCGISEEKARDPASLGLLGMRERVFPFGGVIVVEGAPQEGTVVTVKVPLR